MTTKLIGKLKDCRGFSELISLILVILSLAIFATGGLVHWVQEVKYDNLQQIAQSMARTISLESRVDSVVYDRLNELEQLLKMDVDMRVEGDFIRGTDKLRLESDFTVYIEWHYEYGVGVIGWKREGTRVATAVGTAEEYFK